MNHFNYFLYPKQYHSGTIQEPSTVIYVRILFYIHIKALQNLLSLTSPMLLYDICCYIYNDYELLLFESDPYDTSPVFFNAPSLYCSCTCGTTVCPW